MVKTGQPYYPLQLPKKEKLRTRKTPISDSASRRRDLLLGDHTDSSLYIDETGIPKKGKKSVGVARQWCGQIGKVDNCQVAVVATLGRGNFSLPIDFRLFLPEDWTKDQKRCEKAKIPVDQAVFKTKHQLALEMVFQVRRNGARFQWVGFDGFYGDNPSFLRQLADNGEVFIGDIHKDHTIYFEDPKPAVPTPTSPRGKQPSKLQAQTRSMRVDNWVRKQAPEAWQRVASSYVDGAVGYAVLVGAKVAAPPGCPPAELCRCHNAAEIGPSQKRYQRKGGVAAAQSQTQEEAGLN